VSEGRSALYLRGRAEFDRGVQGPSPVSLGKPKGVGQATPAARVWGEQPHDIHFPQGGWGQRPI